MAIDRRSRPLCHAIAACQLLSSAMAATTASITVSVPSAAPTTNVVDVSFAGFGIEPSNLFLYTGFANQNDLTVNLLSNLANYTGELNHFPL